MPTPSPSVLATGGQPVAKVHLWAVDAAPREDRPQPDRHLPRSSGAGLAVSACRTKFAGRVTLITPRPHLPCQRLGAARRSAAGARRGPDSGGRARRGCTAIDYLIVTHFHADHDGGMPELAQASSDSGVRRPRSPAAGGRKRAGLARRVRSVCQARPKGRHIVAKPGDRLSLTVWTSCSSALRGRQFRFLSRAPTSPRTPHVPRRPMRLRGRKKLWFDGIRLRFGRFSFLDVGDLTGAPFRPRLPTQRDRRG